MSRAVDDHLVDLFKTEYRGLVAVLCHHYGLADVHLAEDIVSDTFLSAMKSWSHRGVPESPQAWLRKTAHNRLKDYFKRNKIYQKKVLPQVNDKDDTTAIIDLTDQVFEDSMLHMIFVVCDPALSKKAQISLALRVLCGFSIEEISRVLFLNKEATTKTLYRAKKTLSKSDSFQNVLEPHDYADRLDTVLRILYLLFSEGYYSSTKEENIHEDVCWEAMRLAIFLTARDYYEHHAIHALIALMCFHASRLEARKSGDIDLLLPDQDREKWNMPLVNQGIKYLSLAAHSKVITKYHLEASIAYWHTTEAPEKWEHILQLYNRLLTIEYSPLIALNRTYALALANTIEEALTEALKLNLSDNHYYYCLLAELYRLKGDHVLEKSYLEQALKHTVKKSERDLIGRKIAVVSG